MVSRPRTRWEGRHPREAGTPLSRSPTASSRFPAEQRYYDHFSDPIKQVIEARIWAGIHFRNADVQAETLGREVEEYTHTHQFAFAH